MLRSDFFVTSVKESWVSDTVVYLHTEKAKPDVAVSALKADKVVEFIVSIGSYRFLHSLSAVIQADVSELLNDVLQTQ